MRIVALFTIFLCFQHISFAQVDSTARKDTAILDEVKDALLDNIPTITLDEGDMGDAGGQNVSSLLTAGRDPFFSAASFNFSAVRFRIRGYENDHFSTFLNGIPMDNLDNGFTPFGLWGGLNDVMRNRDISWGLRNSTFTFGDIGGNTNIDARASKQRAQTQLSYAASNRNYNNRIMLTHSTGVSKKGWAFTISGSRRWAEEGYVPGTYYDGWAFFAGIDKKINRRHLVSLTVFDAPTENGRQGASVQEMIDLAGTPYYNPNWGYQNGKKRNVSVGRTHQPVVIFNHEFTIRNNTSLTTALSVSSGNRAVTGFDWYNAADPRPDYYRYLPSYTGLWANSPDWAQADRLASLMRSDINLRQINWQRLYDVNRSSYTTVKDANGIVGNDISGNRSRYIVENRIINTTRFNFNSVLNSRIGNHLDLTVGLSYQTQQNHYFKKVEDLLGGDFYVNVNQFAERDFGVGSGVNQFDVDRPNRILKVGDRFGYDYNLNISRAASWVQGVFKFNKFDFFLAGNLYATSFYRQGNVRNGIFPSESLGKGTVNNFLDYAGKAGMTYKINGRNYVFINGAYLTRAPYFENVYISPRTRNAQQSDLQSEEILTGEAAYVLNAPKVRARIGGYYTQFRKGMDIMIFYHDFYQNFVNYAIRGIDRLHFGGEFGIEVKLSPTLTVNAAAAVGRYYFDSRQQAIVTVDNSAAVIGRDIIYMENFKVPSTPMEAYSVSLNYRSPKFWFVSLTGSYFDQSYLSMNPLRRTWEALQYLSPGTADYKSVFEQTKFDAQYTIDFFGGYSWKLPRAYEVNDKSTFLVFNVGINNLLNNKKIVTGGFEQLRYDQQLIAADPVQVGKFPPRLFYAYGLNFFASATLRF
ncbi:MAG: TonB-dependent receptor [Bacteroidetes bacterium]|nr:TonB-dependent receptor [Bacteroidota bacterium]